MSNVGKSPKSVFRPIAILGTSTTATRKRKLQQVARPVSNWCSRLWISIQQAQALQQQLNQHRVNGCTWPIVISQLSRSLDMVYIWHMAYMHVYVYEHNVYIYIYILYYCMMYVYIYIYIYSMLVYSTMLYYTILY